MVETDFRTSVRKQARRGPSQGINAARKTVLDIGRLQQRLDDRQLEAQSVDQQLLGATATLPMQRAGKSTVAGKCRRCLAHTAHMHQSNPYNDGGDEPKLMDSAGTIETWQRRRRARASLSSQRQGRVGKMDTPKSGGGVRSDLHQSRCDRRCVTPRRRIL